MKFFIYQIFIHLVIFLSPLKFIWRGLKQSDYLKFIPERYGIYRFTQKRTQDIIWFHCVSLGETKAIEKLLNQIQTEFNRSDILITHGTPTGRNVHLRTTKKVKRAYLCFDSFILNKIFLDYFKPKVAIFLETEIWPGVINELKSRKIPSLLINARLSERSLKKYLRFKTFSEQTINKFDLIIAQSEEDKRKFQYLFHKEILVTNNLKFFQNVNLISSKEKKVFKDKFRISNQTIISLISSRKGEEEIFLDQIKEKINTSKIILIIVPRHPERFKMVKKLVKKKLFTTGIMTSKYISKKPPSIIIGDTMGDVQKYISMSDLVFIGGSFKNFGSQSPVDSILLQKPTFVGPSIFNFKSIIDKGIESKVIQQIKLSGIAEAIIRFSDKKYKGNLKKNMGIFIKENQKDELKMMNLIKKYF